MYRGYPITVATNIWKPEEGEILIEDSASLADWATANYMDWAIRTDVKHFR